MSVDAYIIRYLKVNFIKPELALQIDITPENVSTKNSNELCWNFFHQLRQFLKGLDEDQRLF